MLQRWKMQQKFVTDANGQLAIQNLLMSTNGTDKITYKFIETKNPNYGYLAYENGVVEMTMVLHL